MSSDSIAHLTSCFNGKFKILLLLIFVNIVFITITYNTLRSDNFIQKKWFNLKNVYVQNIIFNRQLEQLETSNDHQDIKRFDVLLQKLQPQKCKIPKLDPYHPDVKPYISYFTKPSCEYPQLTRVSDEGLLQVVNKTKITDAKFAYIQRVNDDRNKLTDWVVFFDKDRKIDKDVKLTEDFVRVQIKSNGISVEEYHMYPVRSKDNEIWKEGRNASRLNIVFVMVDSMSHSNAKRYLKRTIKRLRQSPSSIIMNGHTIVGDGTTAQICAMFVGESEDKLPEARRGFKGAKTVDHWPLIFKEFGKLGYETAYSEDAPFTNTFNYRLKGFESQPVDRYGRTFWRGAESYVNRLNEKNPRCGHQINLKYLKRLLSNFKDKPVFAMMSHSQLAHDYTPNVQLIDEDLDEMFRFLDNTKLSSNTVYVIFGDHGDRSGKFRATMTGKLEERLPFLSFTFPPWFPKKYPKEFQNFQQNSNMLTSHFDIYSTLKHLMDFPENKHKHKFGKSLFTDIASLNRTCPDAGVLEHWCSCVDYKEVSVNDTRVKEAANAIIDVINKKISSVEKANDNCHKVKLKKIERAGLIAPSTRVQSFLETFRDGTCDECGVREANLNFQTENYEIVFEVSPSGGKFEGRAVFHKDTMKFTANDVISRVNRYNNQPACIASEFPHLRQFCYCKNQGVHR